jgi:hypothetical protein
MLSVYDPVRKRIVFGAEAEALRANGGAAPASPPFAGPNVIPPAQPNADPVEANPAAGYVGGNSEGAATPLPGASQFAAPLPGQPSAASPPMQLPAASPAARGGAAIIRPQPGGVVLPEQSVTLAQPPAAPAPAPASNAGGGMMRQPLGAYYQQLEQERGLPPGFLARTRAIESANGTNLVNKNSSARGDFQFIRSTAKAFGIDPMDPYASAKAAADMAAQNMRTMQAKGITPDGADLYAAHQQGIGGYLKLRNGQTTGDAAMRLNGGAGLSASDMLAKWRTAYNNAKPANLGGDQFVPQLAASPDANRGQGPTVAAANAQGGVQNLNPAPDNTYKGGILGLFGMGDQSQPGMNKDFGAKMSDMMAQPGGGAIGGLVKALPSLLGGGGTTQRAPMQFGPAPEDHKPEASLLPLLQASKRGRRIA